MRIIKNKIVYEENINSINGKVSMIIFPDSLQEIKNLIKTTKKDIIFRGAGSSFTGAVIPKDSMVVDFSKMNKILEISPARKMVVLEPGVIVDELNEELEQYGLEFPIIPLFSGVETIGGVIAKNSSGSQELKYNRAINWIDSIEVINSKGEQVKIPKSDLSDFVGMEGTTGAIIKATLRLTSKKERTLTILKSERLSEVTAISRKLRFDPEICSIEILNPTISVLLGLDKKYYLFVEYESNKGFFKLKDYSYYMAKKKKIYKKMALEGFYLIESAKVSSDSIEDLLIFLEERKIPYFGPISSGLIYLLFRPEQKQKLEETLEFARKLRARISYNFGIGLTKKSFLEPGEANIIRRVKKRLDPEDKFNTGKLIDSDEKDKRKVIAEESEEIEEIKEIQIEKELEPEQEAMLEQHSEGEAQTLIHQVEYDNKKLKQEAAINIKVGEDNSEVKLGEDNQETKSEETK